jgi:hypothetical protein
MYQKYGKTNAEIKSAQVQDLHSAEAVEKTMKLEEQRCSCRIRFVVVLLETHVRSKNEFRRW